MVINSEIYKGFKTTEAKSPKVWRAWLAKNYALEKSVWLIIYKKKSKAPSVTYKEAVEEALCYGWIDSLPNKRDEQSYYQYFAKRNPRSNWSKVNKNLVNKLIEDQRMANPGLEMVRLAKANGTWDALNDVDNLILPSDLQTAMNNKPLALQYWNQFPDSTKRGILEWIFNAKRPATRTKRIEETVEKAEQNIRANQYRQ